MKEKDKEKEKKLERGVETFFKTASRNHMQLSSMADNKAHILLSINSIIISLVISVFAKRLEQSPYLIFPTALLMAVCLASVVFAVKTTQPKISGGVFTKDQVANREANLMFFGNFHKMDLETYDWGVRELIRDNEYLYGSMTRDVYYLGKVLAIKYRFLNIGYKVFMFGLIASVLAFAICFAIGPKL
ncbi:MAG TPA: Pycsar system effector family protein [Puia sp.]